MAIVKRRRVDPFAQDGMYAPDDPAYADVSPSQYAPIPRSKPAQVPPEAAVAVARAQRPSPVPVSKPSQGAADPMPPHAARVEPRYSPPSHAERLEASPEAVKSLPPDILALQSPDTEVPKGQQQQPQQPQEPTLSGVLAGATGDDKVVSEGGGWRGVLASPDFGKMLQQIGLGILSSKSGVIGGIGEGIGKFNELKMYEQERAADEQYRQDRLAESRADRESDEAYRDKSFGYQRERDLVGDAKDDRTFDQRERADTRDFEYQMGRDATRDRQWQMSYSADRGDAAVARAQNRAELGLRARKQALDEQGGAEDQYNFSEVEANGQLYPVRRQTKGGNAGSLEYQDADGTWKNGTPAGATRPTDGWQGDVNASDVKTIYTPTVDAGIAADKELMATDRILDLLSNTDKAYYGPGQEGLNNVKKMLVGAGIASQEVADDISSIEQATAMAGDAMLSKMKMLGGNDNVEEMRKILALGFNPSDSWQGNVEKMRQVRAGLGYVSEKGRYFRDSAQSPKQTLRAWEEQNKGRKIYEGLRADGQATKVRPTREQAPDLYTPDGRYVDDL